MLTPTNNGQRVFIAMRGTKPGAASRASADLRAMEATTGDVYFVRTDSKQLVALAGLENTDHFIHSFKMSFFLRKGPILVMELRHIISLSG